MLQIYLLLGAIAVFALLGVGVMRVVDSYNEAVQSATSAKEDARLARLSEKAFKERLAERQRQFDLSESISQERGKREREYNAKLSAAEAALAEARKEPSVAAFLDQPVPAILRGRSADARPGSGTGLQPPDGGLGAPRGPSPDRREGR